MRIQCQVTNAGIQSALDAMKKQVPFVLALAMTELANDARTEVVRQLPHNFIIRNRFTAMGIHTKRAEKNDYPKVSSLVGSVDKYMIEHEEGGPRKKGPKAFSFPYRIRRNIRTLVKRGKWPGPLLGGKKLPKKPAGRPKGSVNGRSTTPKPFIHKFGRFTGVYIRTSGLANSRYKYKNMRRQRFKLLWRLYSPTIRIPEVHWLVPPVNRIVQTRYEQVIVSALYKAVNMGVKP